MYQVHTPLSKGGLGGGRLGPPVTSRGSYTTPVQVDPFAVPAEEKLFLLLEADKGMASVKGIRARQGTLVSSATTRLVRIVTNSR